MPRIPSILAHILASTALVACGGAVSEVPEQGGTTPTGSGSPGSSTTPSNPPPPTPIPTPPARDASAPSADAGCTTGPVLLKSAGCTDVWYSACGVPPGVVVADGLSQEECNQVCGSAGPNMKYWGCGSHLEDDVPGTAFDCYTCAEGRRPQGYVTPPLEGEALDIGGWLAHAADLERVSVDAFQILRRELEHHGAPAALQRRAARAEADEVRHTRALATLARREGAALSSAPVAHGEIRALEAIALENAVEGCIRETYGALVAGWQAQHAGRLEIRRVMTAIYVDETSHSALAWDVHAWIMERLTAPQRARVESAMADAIAELTAAARYPLAGELVASLGLPPPAEATRLVDGLQVHLFQAALAS